MNIEKAIQEEQAYLKDRLEKHKDTSLLARLSIYGYDSLDKYFSDKKDFLLKNTHYEVYNGEASNLIIAGRQAITAQTPMILMPQLNSISAWRGLDTPVDFNLCKELGVEVYEVGAPGGIIVTSPNDFSIEILIPENIDINDQCFLEKFKTYYDKYFDNVEINNNDILINGKKIQGSGSVRANGMYLFMTQVSFEDHFDIINQICQKKSSKQPGIIDSTILSKQMLQEEVLSWL